MLRLLVVGVSGAVLAFALGGSAAGRAVVGPRWRMQAVVAGSDSRLFGVGCPLKSACIAVGGIGPTSLIERWNGHSWREMGPPVRGVLTAVSCFSANACTAVGDGPYADHPMSFAEHWNGRRWSVQRPPKPPASRSNVLASVSCPSAKICFAAGFSAGRSRVGRTLIERWGGHGWAIQHVPSPGDALTIGLNGVSCASTSACTAIGSYRARSGQENLLVESWNGHSWTVRTPLNSSAPRDLSLFGVSCSATTVCTAVGGYSHGRSFLALAERWDGKHWVRQSTPNTARARNASLVGVSCSRFKSCVAVGYDSRGTFNHPIVERWNGHQWQLETVPYTRMSGSLLYGVSCPSAGVCTAVGFQLSSQGQLTALAYRYS